jgi:hypothetical protein
MFGRVIRGAQAVDLTALGVDPAPTPNVALLGDADLLRRLVPASLFDIRHLDPAFRLAFRRRVPVSVMKSSRCRWRASDSAISDWTS